MFQTNFNETDGGFQVPDEKYTLKNTWQLPSSRFKHTPNVNCFPTIVKTDWQPKSMSNLVNLKIKICSENWLNYKATLFHGLNQQDSLKRADKAAVTLTVCQLFASIQVLQGCLTISSANKFKLLLFDTLFYTVINDPF